MLNALEIKEKIISILRRRGPSLPVHISKEIGLSILFTSAFLSELFSEKKIKMSNMRVGSSPVYFLQEQEPKLENFSQHLKSREKDALILLKEKKFLKDSEQEPAIRIALREIKDFAIPFEKNSELLWRFFTISETELEEKPQEIKPVISIVEIEKKQDSEELKIFEEKIPLAKIKPKEKKAKKSKPKKTDDKFFNKVKEFLSKRSTEISDIESVSKKELILKIKNSEGESLLVAYNKKKITEKDIIKAQKKSSELALQYTILSLGEIPKKTQSLIEALKNLSSIEKIE